MDLKCFQINPYGSYDECKNKIMDHVRSRKQELNHASFSLSTLLGQYFYILTRVYQWSVHNSNFIDNHTVG
jgi:hypothetical protein